MGKRLKLGWSKNRHLAIYPQPQFHAILFISKELSPLTLTEVDSFRSAWSVIDCHQPPNFPSHPSLPIFTLLKNHTTKKWWKRKEKKVVKDHSDVPNSFSSPVFSSFLPHLLLFYSYTLCVVLLFCGEEMLVGKKRRAVAKCGREAW